MLVQNTSAKIITQLSGMLDSDWSIAALSYLVIFSLLIVTIVHDNNTIYYTLIW